jgi:hypothetical protein
MLMLVGTEWEQSGRHGTGKSDGMKLASYVATAIGGAIVCFLLLSLGIVDRVDGIPGTQEEPMLNLPTYLSFLSVMLTAVTAILAALAIGIGVVAAYTFREIRDEARKAVVSKVDDVLSDDAINARINRIAFAQRRAPTVAELEDDFDPEDDGNR